MANTPYITNTIIKYRKVLAAIIFILYKRNGIKYYEEYIIYNTLR